MAGAGALLLAGCLHSFEDEMVPRLREIETRLGGRLGVAMRDTQSRERLQYRADERFAMASTFKLALAAAVLAQVDSGAVKLDQTIRYGEAELLGYAPVARAHVTEGALSVEALCAAIVEVSDNTAANLLLALIGGPPALTAFFRAHGDKVSRLDRTEPELNTNLDGDPRDTTTPRAMLDTMNTLVLGEALSPRSRMRLQAWLVKASTGLNRLRGGLPGTWLVGDKTGNGGNGAVNDIAVAWPPDRGAVLISVYSSNTNPDARAAAFADIGRLAVSFVQRQVAH